MLSLITGGSRGIGFAIAQELAFKGSDLLLVAKSQPNLKKAEAAIKEKSTVKVGFHVCDLSHERNVDLLAEACIKNCTIPDFLVLDAGIFLEGSLANSRPEDF